MLLFGISEDPFNGLTLQGMRDCRKGKIDKILVKSVARFARNTRDCLVSLRELKSLGVSVRFEKENIDIETLTIELMVSVSGSLAHSDNLRMAIGNQSDKEFAIPGPKWRRYVSSDRITRPILHKDIINEVIEPGYIEQLMPERRFDQTLYFTYDTKVFSL